MALVTYFRWLISLATCAKLRTTWTDNVLGVDVGLWGLVWVGAWWDILEVHSYHSHTHLAQVTSLDFSYLLKLWTHKQRESIPYHLLLTFPHAFHLRAHHWVKWQAWLCYTFVEKTHSYMSINSSMLYCDYYDGKESFAEVDIVPDLCPAPERHTGYRNISASRLWCWTHKPWNSVCQENQLMWRKAWLFMIGM